MNALEEYEDRVRRHALALAGDQSPYYNIAPLMQLIRDAWDLGYEVTSKTEAKPSPPKTFAAELPDP